MLSQGAWTGICCEHEYSYKNIHISFLVLSIFSKMCFPKDKTKLVSRDFSENHAIIKFGKVLQDQVQPLGWISSCPLNHTVEWQFYLFFECFQGRWLHHFPRELVPMLTYSFREEIISLYSTWNSPDSAWGNFPLSSRELSGRRDWAPPPFRLL